MMGLNLDTMVLCACLNALGGYHWLFCRRITMPLALGWCVSQTSGIWWLGLTCLPALGTMTEGYFGDSNDGRAWWLVTQAAALSIGVTVTGHLWWPWFIVFVAGSFFLGHNYKDMDQLEGDALVGAYLSLFIWGVHA